MDKSASILCWTTYFILHGEIISQPLYENHQEDQMVTNRTYSYYREVYDREIFLENHVKKLNKELQICRDGTDFCLADPNCFLPTNFTFDDSYNVCYGDMYIKNSTYNPGKYVGIILCSPTRYHLFLSDDIYGMFYNIADGSGSGDDHCELVGGNSSTAIVSADYRQSPGIKGYYRNIMNDAFKFGDIGFLGPSNNWFGTWLECGVTIPDDVYVHRE